MAYTGSTADQLVAVRTAIGECLTSQQYSIRGRMVQRAMLKDLRALEKDLMAQEEVESSSGGMVSLGIVARPS